MRPNIFDIATKELNQDAFIAWLIQYADQQCEEIDVLLNQCGKEFVKELIKKQIPDFNDDITKVNVIRQRKNIDVWSEVNDKYLIVIEDKTNTTHHSNQLLNYKTIAKLWCVENNYSPPICIYLKTGNESQASLNIILKEEFSIFNRQNFINLLNKYNKIENNIFKDFQDRLNRIEKSHSEFENRNIGEWTGSDWQGFFQLLDKQIGLNYWSYVNNPSGGFWNAVLNLEYWDIYPVYIQIEQGKLCFKISTDLITPDTPENIVRGEIRRKFHNIIMTRSQEMGMTHIKRPVRFGNGKYMTVAIVDKENWLGSNNSILDQVKVTNTLHMYKQFLLAIL